MLWLQNVHNVSKKVKPLILRYPEQVLARRVGHMRRFQVEQFWVSFSKNDLTDLQQLFDNVQPSQQYHLLTKSNTQMQR